MEKTLLDRFEKELDGVVNCYDRVVITGNLQEWCYAQGMTHYLYLKEGYGYLTMLNLLSHIASVYGRMPKRVQKILKERGKCPGLVHIFSAMEGCNSYAPWHDKTTGKTYLKPDSGKCLHYYFYFMDEELGLCYLRVPTWYPFRLQFYFNGHGWLASKLRAANIEFETVDNAFARIANYESANQLAGELDITTLHQRLNALASLYCPVVAELNVSYHWSIMQAEYATDLVFKNQGTLQAFYPHLLETLIHAVKPADIATFLDRKLSGNYQGEPGNRFNKRWLGTRIKHQMGPVSIKMYDKFSFILRIETTINNVSFFVNTQPCHCEWLHSGETLFNV